MSEGWLKGIHLVPILQKGGIGDYQMGNWMGHGMYEGMVIMKDRWIRWMDGLMDDS